ncbi:MAG: ATP-dependent helicase HrpB [Myxococcota bacterium]
MVHLPIDPLLPEIVSTLKRSDALVLQAAPGAGKTTRVPRALLEAGVAEGKEIVVLQPRRLATRLAAAWVAEELSERLGETVGYQVRFEDLSGPKTRLRFVTEGVLTRRLLSDPRLADVGVVVLDEFHERHLAGDLALAMLSSLRASSRPDLKLVVMSATLDAAPLAAYLGGCPVLRSEGRRFDVALEHLAGPDERPLEQQVLAALKRLVSSGADGDVLVFLPGAQEIRRAKEACQDFAGRQGFEVHALHGDLPNAEQDRAVRPGKKRKVILSTNVAETSVTIEGVAAVIDSGLSRVASHSPWSGLPMLKVAKVSRASATQRAGRAGRTREGRCLRLYTKADFDQRPEHEAPEIRRLDLTESLLALRASGVEDLARFPFFEAPPASALEAADALLRRLGAVDLEGHITAIGKKLLRFPVHPRQARLIVEAENRGVAAEGVTVAAMLGERDIREEARARFGDTGPNRHSLSGPSDLWEMLERFEQARAADFSSSRVRALGLETGAVQAVERVRRQLSRTVDRSTPRPSTAAKLEEAVMLSVLGGYPDRVARRRKEKSSELILFGGGSASLSETSVVREPGLLVAVDAEERPRGVVVRIASEVQPEWLLELFPKEISELDELQWNDKTERVERVTRLSYGNLVLEESRQMAPPSEATSKLLAAAALAAGAERFADVEVLETWLIRVELLAQAFPEASFPTARDSLLGAALEELCAGARSFEELKGASLLHALQASLSPKQAQLLAAHTPERVTLGGGRQVKVHYERGKPPWIESRLQDFFGLAKGPSVGGGRVALVLHLLAPNMRAVQVTTDLAGFWERHYPTIRKELMRKYPRHAWPEDPRTASPPVPRR